MTERNIIGWVAVSKNSGAPIKTNLYPRETAKLYTTLGTAKAAIKQSNYASIFDDIEFIPVHYPN